MSDRFRADLPANSVRIIVEDEESPLPLISSDAKRNDGRETSLFRPIFLEVGFISRASGSAFAEYRNSKVVCSVSGPRPTGAGENFTDIGILHCHFKYSTFARKDCRKGYLQDDEEKEYSVILEESLSSCLCLEKYPKSRFDCFIQVLEDDGSVLPASITAASLAFADAGIEMFDIVTACSAALVKGHEDKHTIVLDPDWKEQSNSIGMLTLVYSPSISSITNLLQTGYFTGPELAEAIELCQDGCIKLYQIVSQTLTNKLSE